MSIRARGNSFLVDIKVRGQRVRQTARTYADAQALEASIRNQLASTPARGLADALADYLTGESTTLRDGKGIKTNAKAIRPYIQFATLDEAPDAAARMRRDWLAEGLKPATINRRLALLRRLCNLAFEWGWTDKAIGRRIKLLPENNARHVYLTPEQVEAIASRMPRAGDLVRFSAYTGLRLGELMRLTARNVTDGAVVLYDTKSTKPRTVPVPDRVAHILKAIPWAVTETVRRDEWEAARKAAGLPHVHWHDLRHTYASWLAARGVGDRELGELLGHSSASMVKRYSHLRADHLRARVADL